MSKFSFDAKDEGAAVGFSPAKVADAVKAATETLKAVRATKGARLDEKQLTNAEVAVGVILMARDVTAMFADLIINADIPEDARAKLIAEGKGRLARQTAINCTKIVAALVS